MNIFVTSECPLWSARWLDDKRVGKMLMEANQMLSQAVKSVADKEKWISYVSPECLVVGTAYSNHPCTLWVRESQGNFLWLVAHAKELAHQFSKRFGKGHASAKRTENIANLYFSLCPASHLAEQTPFANCASNNSLNLSFKHLPVIEAYRAYLNERWKTDVRSVTWKNQIPPHWANV